MADLKDNRFKDQSVENKTKNHTNYASPPEPAIITSVPLPFSRRQASQRVYTIKCDSSEPASPLSSQNSSQNSSPEYASSSNSPQPLRSHDTSKLAKRCVKELVMKESDLDKNDAYILYGCHVRGCKCNFFSSETMDHYVSKHLLLPFSRPAQVWSGENVQFRVSIDDIKDNENTLVGVFGYAGSRNGRKPAERFACLPNASLSELYEDWVSNILVLLFARREPLVPNSKCTAKVYVFHLAALANHLSLKACISIFSQSASQLYAGTVNVGELQPPCHFRADPPPEEDKRFVVHQVHMDKLVEGPHHSVGMLLSMDELLHPNKKSSKIMKYKFIENENRDDKRFE